MPIVAVESERYHELLATERYWKESWIGHVQANFREQVQLFRSALVEVIRLDPDCPAAAYAKKVLTELAVADL
jgi:hypothetical protein